MKQKGQCGINVNRIQREKENRPKWIIQLSCMFSLLFPSCPWDSCRDSLTLEKYSSCSCKNIVVNFNFIFIWVDLLSLASLLCCGSRDIWTEQSCVGASVGSCLLHVLIHSFSESEPASSVGMQPVLHILLGLCWLPVTTDGDKWIQKHLLGLTEGLNSLWTFLMPKLIMLKLTTPFYPLKNRPRLRKNLP